MRKRPRREPLPELYALKVEGLRMLEQMSEQGWIDLVYGDESRVSLQPCVPYAWQFPEEEVFMPSETGQGLNCFALLSRSNACRFETTQQTIDSDFIVEPLDRLSFELVRPTVVVLDNAPPHVAKRVQERRGFWQQRGLFLFYLPPLPKDFPKWSTVSPYHHRLVLPSLGVKRYLRQVARRVTRSGAKRSWQKRAAKRGHCG